MAGRWLMVSGRCFTNGDGRSAVDAWRWALHEERESEFKEGTHSSLIQTGASSSLSLNLARARWSMLGHSWIHDPWLLLHAYMVGGWPRAIEGRSSVVDCCCWWMRGRWWSRVDDGCLTNGDRWSMVKERRSMRSFQKVTVEAYKKVTVLVRLLSSCLVLGGPKWRRRKSFM